MAALGMSLGRAQCSHKQVGTGIASSRHHPARESLINPICAELF